MPNIAPVIEYIGKKESFQFQTKNAEEAGGVQNKSSTKDFDVDSNFYTSLRNASVNLLPTMLQLCL